MLRRIFYTALFIIISGVSAVAQQDPQFTQYMFNTLYVTPAYSGVDGVTQISAFHRSQWLGYESSFGDGGAPITQIITFTTPIFKLRSGFGAYIMNDISGPLNTLEFQASYAYHLGIKNSKLSLGIKVGAISQSIRNDYRYIQPDDPSIPPDGGSQVKPDIGIGALFRSEKYYIGFGVNHLSRAEFDFGVSEARGALENHLNITAGYFHEVSFDLKFNPTVLVKTDFKEYSFDVGLIALIQDKMWAGLSFRQSEAANAMFGYSFLKEKNLKFGYSIDVVVKDQEAKENFSHELMVSYQLPVNPGSGKKVVRTPRYRH